MCDPLCDFVRTKIKVVFMSDFVCFSTCLCLLSDLLSKTLNYMPSSNQRSLPYCPSPPPPQMVRTCSFKHHKFERHFLILLLIVLVNVLRVTLSFILNSYRPCCYSYCYYATTPVITIILTNISLSTLLLVFYHVEHNME